MGLGSPGWVLCSRLGCLPWGGSCRPPPHCPQGSLSHGWVPGRVRSPGNSPQGGWDPPVPRGGGSPCSPGEGAGRAAGWGWGMPRGCWAGARGMHRSHWGGQRGRQRAALGRERPRSGEGTGGCPGGPGEGAGVYWRGGRGCAQQALAKAAGMHGERRGAGEGPGVGDWEGLGERGSAEGRGTGRGMAGWGHWEGTGTSTEGGDGAGAGLDPPGEERGPSPGKGQPWGAPVPAQPGQEQPLPQAPQILGGPTRALSHRPGAAGLPWLKGAVPSAWSRLSPRLVRLSRSGRAPSQLLGQMNPLPAKARPGAVTPLQPPRTPHRATLLPRGVHSPSPPRCIPRSPSRCIPHPISRRLPQCQP